MNGLGTCTWKDGTSYNGLWNDFIKVGKGTLSYSDGSVYSGSFV